MKAYLNIPGGIGKGLGGYVESEYPHCLVGVGAFEPLGLFLEHDHLSWVST